MSILFVDSIQPKTTGGNVTIPNLEKEPSGKVLQCQTVVSNTDSTVPSGYGSVLIPGGSTPTVSQGYPLLTKAITPLSSTSTLIAQARLYFMESSNTDQGNMATMFKDSSLISFIGNQLFVYSYGYGQFQTPMGDMQSVTTGHTKGTAVNFRCNVGSSNSTATSPTIRLNNGAGGIGGSYTSFAIPSSLIIWEVES